MADIQGLQQFAADHAFDLTRPLRNAQVVQLAEFWLPRMMFYEDERFHPISLDEVFSMVDSTFGALPESAKATFRLTKAVRTGATTFDTQTFDPPMVYEPAPLFINNTVVKAVIPLDSGTTAENALSLPEADSSTVVSHGASFRRSNMFFGPIETISGTNTASPGDPFLPRAPQITVMALLENLVDLLKYELTVAEANDYPPDGMRGGFDVVDDILRRVNQQAPFLSASQKRQILLGMIASFESNGTIPPPTLPPGWIIDRVAWDTITRFTFLEYVFFYAYNDFERYQTAIFDNEHEGDDEGCCLVFDRSAINVAAVSTDPTSLRRVVPFAIITSVHEEYMNADLFKFVQVPPPDPANPPLARDVVDFTVFIAGGSHATYLTPGQHDLVDFGDYFGYVEEKIPILLILFPLVLVIAIILSIIEHFIDTEDYTSEDGIHSGPPEITSGDPQAFPSRVVVLPMSADNHIYLPANEALLRLRGYAGKWGGHDGAVDHSPQLLSKSGRYFRKLLRNR